MWFRLSHMPSSDPIIVLNLFFHNSQQLSWCKAMMRSTKERACLVNTNLLVTCFTPKGKHKSRQHQHLGSHPVSIFQKLLRVHTSFGLVIICNTLRPRCLRSVDVNTWEIFILYLYFIRCVSIRNFYYLVILLVTTLTT